MKNRKQCAVITTTCHLLFESVNDLASYLNIPQNSASDRLVRFKHLHDECYFATSKQRDNAFRNKNISSFYLTK